MLPVSGVHGQDIINTLIGRQDDTAPVDPVPGWDAWMGSCPPIHCARCQQLVMLLAERPRVVARGPRHQGSGALHHWWCLLQGRLEPVADPVLRIERQVAAVSTFILHIGLVLALMLASLVRTPLPEASPEERIAVRFSQGGRDGGAAGDVPSPAPYRRGSPRVSAGSATVGADANLAGAIPAPTARMPQMPLPESAIQNHVPAVRERTITPETDTGGAAGIVAVTTPAEGIYVEITDPQIARALASVPPPPPLARDVVPDDRPVSIVEREVALRQNPPAVAGIVATPSVVAPGALSMENRPVIEREVAAPLAAPRRTEMPLILASRPEVMPGSRSMPTVIEREVALAGAVPAVRTLAAPSLPAPLPVHSRQDVALVERTVDPGRRGRAMVDSPTGAITVADAPAPSSASMGIGSGQHHSEPADARSGQQGVAGTERAGGQDGQDWSRGHDTWTAGSPRGTEGWFDGDGRPRLAQDAAPARGAPGSEADSWTRERLSRAGTWLKRPPYEHRPTSFDRYWVPHESLLAEWVRKGIQRIAIPVPGTGTTLQCVISMLQLGGGCGLSDPALQEQAATARAAPDIPFKPGLQEDNGSL